jgi:LPS sulfotransferase NodH
MLRLPDQLHRMHNVHLDHVRDKIPDPGKCDLTAAKKLQFLFICYTNRCGSNFVAELLASTGAYNLAGEFFNHDTVNNHMQTRALKDIAAYFEYLCDTQSKNGKLASKLAVTHLQILHMSGILDQIIDRCRFLVVERNDRLMQAISMSIASQTGQWASYMPSRTPHSDAEFSRKQIEAVIEGTIKQQRVFDLFFAYNGIDHHKIIYEQLVSAPELNIEALSGWLGESIGRVNLEKIKLQRQMSTKNVEWRRLFLEER